MALTREIIGQRLAQARHHAGLTQQHVAAYLDLKREQVSYIETGQRPIDIPTLQRLADLYGYELSYFLQEDPMPESEISPTVIAAFRTAHITSKDLETIRWVKRFTMNLDSLNRLLEENGE
ncbi:Transcriptional regulator, contains XRE-family HTH domain [Sulfobacillus thermosulfidooxidans DSM 9293]|uniref:Transcriptional regulator, contains XRE-family HTH domain n=2 Tax=Sulfobacillus thermosulfidooxidans TaxID=28034 RepID=A0A1W1W6S1_SULTA|nr:helix-turn-helix transcriptional regulator [Sulfobacillus thermosulfidooxidans]SMC01987.1 Transcriptional regulator, contains XRE-family HTH domain [Sulfobacillus thermosulfidooxidans DSM 9293]